MNYDSIAGCLLGTAVGDALGLPYEKLTRRRASVLLGAPDQYRFFFGRGMISDDTEHTCIVAQALVESGLELPKFQRALSRRLRLWILSFPAGAGSATLRSIVRLWLGVSPNRSGVKSAGNGPAMRAAILGVSISDANRLREFVHASTIMTHSDSKAEYGAMAIALAARFATQSLELLPEAYLVQLKECLEPAASELIHLVEGCINSVAAGQTTIQFAELLGLTKGVSGYMYHTVPIVLHAWFTHSGDYRSAVMSVIECGGDADTTAAILGGIIGAKVGAQGIPQAWRDELLEWPRTVLWMERLASQLVQVIKTDTPTKPVQLRAVPLLLRNLLFLMLVLYHGFRRLLPPY